jgi:hypothetical protein
MAEVTVVEVDQFDADIVVPSPGDDADASEVLSGFVQRLANRTTYLKNRLGALYAKAAGALLNPTGAFSEATGTYGNIMAQTLLTGGLIGDKVIIHLNLIAYVTAGVGWVRVSFNDGATLYVDPCELSTTHTDVGNRVNFSISHTVATDGALQVVVDGKGIAGTLHIEPTYPGNNICGTFEVLRAS